LIERLEMQEVASRFRNPTLLILGSHSALDAWQGARNYGLRALIYTTRERARIYLQNAMAGAPGEVVEDLPSLVKRDVIVVEDPADAKRKAGWRSCIVVLDSYMDVVKYVDDLLELECLQVPNRAFSVYVGGDERCSVIEDRFAVPIFGSRRLLKVENRGEIERDYYWLAEKAGIPYPRGFKFSVLKDGSGIKMEERVGRPLILKAESAQRRLERGFIFAANSEDLEEKVRREVEAGRLDAEGLRHARVEEYVPGPHANFNFFYSPLNAKEDWGDVERYYAKLYGLSLEEARSFLANELISIDERREATHDGVVRLPASVQLEVDWSKTPYPLSFEVTLHGDLSIRESLLKDVLLVANSFLRATQLFEPPGIIGAWCLQTIVTWTSAPKVKAFEGVGLGLYDLAEAGEVYMHVPFVQDVALRHGGGANVHMAVGGKYASARYAKRMSVGDRIALEVRRAQRKGMLKELVT
jgi:5-formaminoimidazole-4-carboxamide-1-(beta)-D-ribofuranosyl 5'-monophosphate synthetase